MLFIWKFSVQVLLKPILKCCLGSPKFTSYEITNHDMKHQTGLIYIFLRWLPYTYVHASFVAQTAKTLPAIQKTQIQSLSWEDPLKKEIATYSSTLALENPMDRGDCLLSGDSHSLWYHKRPDMTEQLALNYTYIHLCMEVRVQNEIFPEWWNRYLEIPGTLKIYRNIN